MGWVESMRRSVALLLALFLIGSCLIEAKPVSSAADLENTWVSKASMNTARGYLGVAVVNDKIYAIGGDQGHLMGNAGTYTTMTSEVTNATEEYDPSSNRWVSKSQMPTARARFGTAVYQNKIYCIGGYKGEVIVINPGTYEWKTEYYDVSANEAYYPGTNTWEVKKPLPTPRHNAATNMVNGKIYVIGGYSIETHSILNVLEVYDPETDTWAAKTPPPLKVWGSTSAVVDNKIFVLGEEVIDPALYHVGYRVQVYDPANDSWIIKASAPTIPFSTAVATTGLNALNRIYFFDETSNDVYDPSNGSWSVGSPAPTHRPVAGAVAIDDLIYVIGGRTGQWGYMVDMKPSTANEQYTPFGYGAPDPSIDLIAPKIEVLTPESKIYYHTNVTLDFTVNETTSRLSYSLDGQRNMTVTGNTTLNGLPVGMHNVTVYAWDTAGNGASETIIFTVAEPEASPVVLVVTASIASLSVMSICLLIYLKKRNQEAEKDLVKKS
jgi:N-acetylneuraminic acid mutarotase